MNTGNRKRLTRFLRQPISLFSGKIKEVHFEEDRKPSDTVYSDTVYCLCSLLCTDKSKRPEILS